MKEFLVRNIGLVSGMLIGDILGGAMIYVLWTPFPPYDKIIIFVLGAILFPILCFKWR